MKKLLLLGFVMLFMFCAPKKTTVETEGLEEVIVFGEEESINISEEPVLPQPAEEEVVAPPVAEEETVTPPPAEEEIIAPPPVEEEVVITPPPIEEEPVVPIEETPPAVTEEPYMPPTITPSPTPPPKPAPASVLGFRVQVFASSTEKNASKVADDARAAFEQSIYVQHVAPYYKVRVGNCLTREDAEVLKRKALKLGYRGAFIVETMISP
jgi:hypothetical protein